MTEEKKQSSILSKFLIPVLIALIVGGSTPWWLEDLREYFSDQTEQALEDYKTVQAIYSKAKGTKVCTQLRSIVEELKVYENNKLPVPESFHYTIKHPNEMSHPKISDLVVDRTYRVKNLNASCFSG